MIILFDFDTDAACNSWSPINDVVMGGVSYSRFEYAGESTAKFSGTVSLENSGGFASVRSVPSLYDLGKYAGLLLRVRGDGKKYKMNLKTEATLDGVQYQAVFETQQNVWTEIAIPFSKFVPMFRGVPAQHSPMIDRASICSFGFLISDKQEGPFRVDIDWIRGYP
jgi:NADH dehydrogenase [ubiquinone] 1 alpha subcomplex assembly factor 1